MIASFVDRIAELNPQLVTFNGSLFDLTVLRYRAMVHKLPAIRVVGALISEREGTQWNPSRENSGIAFANFWIRSPTFS
jgi:predicted PolB exonuclease-like 3'-5' exonuclease